MAFLKRTAVAVLGAVMILAGMNTVFAESIHTVAEITARDAAATEAEALLGALLGQPAHVNTRAEFTAAAAGLMQLTGYTPEQPGFKDVPLTHDYAEYIYAAAGAGVISPGEVFRPDDPISAHEAITIVVKMIGYGDYAKRAGGYPAGYIKAAEYAQILSRINVSEEFSEDDAKILLLNALNSRTLRFSGVYQQKVSDESYLVQHYKLERVQGVLNETPVNSLYEEKTEFGSSEVVIGEKRFAASQEDYGSLLGYMVTAYYDEDEKVVSLTAAKNNVTAAVDAYDTAEVSGVGVVFHNENGKSTVKLSDGYVVLYNGGYSSERLAPLLEKTDGGIELIDNDRDGRYDIVKMAHAEYITVSALNRVHQTISDQNSVENSLDLSHTDMMYSFYNSKGPLRFLDIQENDVYEVYKSCGGRIITAYKLEEKIAGSVGSITEDGVYIDNVCYKTTDYFDRYYTRKAALGAQGSFVLSRRGRLVSFETDTTEMKYAYLYRIFMDEETDKAFVRLFTEDGELKKLELAENVRIDNDRYKREHAYNFLFDNVQHQLIRFKTDGEGKLKYVDTAEEQKGVVTKDRPENNSLTRCVFDRETFNFKSGTAAMYPSFNVESTKVFVIPSTNDNPEDYVITGNGFFIDGKDYSGMHVYDVGMSGTAGAVVIHADDTVADIALRAPSFVVEKIEQEYNENRDEIMYAVYGWQDNQYASYYVDNSLSLVKASGELLGFGDIIRFRAVDGIIKKLACDFDANENVFGKNNTTNAVFNGANVGIGYQFGRAYAIEGQWIYMTDTPEIRYETDKLRNFMISTNYIAIVDMDSRKIKTGKLSDISTLRSRGKGDVILLRQKDLGALSLIAYTE